MADEEILHQDDVEKVIDEQLDGDGTANTAIANLAAASSSYVQAEATATRTTLNAVLAALRNSGIIPSS